MEQRHEASLIPENLRNHCHRPCARRSGYRSHMHMKNILLLGDSIRQGYEAFVRDGLLGRANVFFPVENGRFAQYTLRALSEWKESLSLPQIDIVHWNNGLWDSVHLNDRTAGCEDAAEGSAAFPADRPPDGEFDAAPMTPPEIYRYYIGRVLTRIRQIFPGADVVFATTTPVIEEQAPGVWHSNREIENYNRIAREVLVPRGVYINELGDFAARNCQALHRDRIHYNDEGSAILADEIIHFLEKEGLI